MMLFSRHHRSNLLLSGLLLFLLVIFQPESRSAESDDSVAELHIGAQTIRFVSPPGFVDVSRRNAKLWAHAKIMDNADILTLAHLVTEKDLETYDKTQVDMFESWLLVQTPVSHLDRVATQAQFDNLRIKLVAMQVNLKQSLEPQLSAETNRVSKALSKIESKQVGFGIGQVVPISVDRNDTQGLIYSTKVQVNFSTETSNTAQYNVSTSAYCFIKGKLVILGAFRSYYSDKDIKDNQELMMAWVKSLLSANGG
ncbi:hypothetical protein H8K32_05300 [Undibacterium jejuense]|uniref:Uncharacterized protein n=1 Tax=Undibacterium jejuense TaxID=1344949 RepID=A0A923KK67_9BURK|nr:hypothetical protein [Undibacterium jejuense]MBC3861510.1 hypothetical protein [Undibacterium jejuense]